MPKKTQSHWHTPWEDYVGPGVWRIATHTCDLMNWVSLFHDIRNRLDVKYYLIKSLIFRRFRVEQMSVPLSPLRCRYAKTIMFSLCVFQIKTEKKVKRNALKKKKEKKKRTIQKGEQISKQNPLFQATYSWYEQAMKERN